MALLDQPNAVAMASIEAVFREHGVSTQRLRPHFGLAFAPGAIDLSRPGALPQKLDEALNDAFHCFGLLVFRELDLEPERELDFCRRFSHDPEQNLAQDRNYGAQIVPGQPKLPNYPAIGLVGGAHVDGPTGHYGFVGDVDANDQPPGGMERSWHCDGVADEDPPPECTAMRSILVPRSGGGATLFASSTRAAALAIKAAEKDPKEWRGAPPLARAMCHYRATPSLWDELEVSPTGISLRPMSDQTAAALAADPVATAKLQAMARDGFTARSDREYLLPMLACVPAASYHRDIATVPVPTMIHQCRALHAVSDVVTGQTLSFEESQNYIERAWRPGLSDPENIIVHHWADRDFVVWNNRTVIHSATSKGQWKRREDDQRLLHRIRMRAHPVTGRVAAWSPQVEAAGRGFGERRLPSIESSTAAAAAAESNDGAHNNSNGEVPLAVAHRGARL